MTKKEHAEEEFLNQIMILLSLFALIIIVLIIYLSQGPTIQGKAIVAEGGLIVELNITTDFTPNEWVGLAGELVSNGITTTQQLTGSQVLRLNLSYSNPTNNTIIIASTKNNPDWNNLTPALPAEIDFFIGIPSTSIYSATNTFTEKKNFTVFNKTYELWATTLTGINTTYETGIMKTNNSYLFIGKAKPGGTGYDGKTTDYELILPGDQNYTFYVTEDYLPPLGCENFNATAELAQDNQSIIISWENIPGVSSYEISYVDGPSNGYLNFSNATTVYVAGNNWQDNPPNERYYKVKGGACEANQTLGIITLNLTPDYNLISMPFKTKNQSIEETLRSINGKYDSVNEFNNTGKLYNFYLIIGSNVFKNFDTIKPGNAYWVRVSENASLRLAGEKIDSINITLTPEYNLIGLITINNNQQNNTIPYVMASIDGDYDAVYEYDNNIKLYNFYFIVGSNVFKNFDTIKPGKAYWVRVDKTTNLIYKND